MLPTGILAVDNISVADPAASKKRVLERAAQLLALHGGEPTTEAVFEHLLDRERLGSTGLAGGVALPHARMSGIDKTRGAFIRLASAVEFDALDGNAVDLVFALLVPENTNEAHLQLLAKLAGMFSDESVRERLRQADAPTALAILVDPAEDHAE